MLGRDILNFEQLEFDWDIGNIEKSEALPLSSGNKRKHGITIGECEEVFLNMPLVLEDQRHSKNEKRFWAVGHIDSKKLLHITFTIRSGKIRVISARQTSKKERQVYEKAKKNTRI